MASLITKFGVTNFTLQIRFLVEKMVDTILTQNIPDSQIPLMLKQRWIVLLYLRAGYLANLIKYYSVMLGPNCDYTWYVKAIVIIFLLGCYWMNSNLKKLMKKWIILCVHLWIKKIMNEQENFYLNNYLREHNKLNE